MTNEINMMSRILSSHYVFYERLNDTDETQEHKDLYKIVRNRMTEAADAASEARADVSFIYAQADKEREKELALIERMIGIAPEKRDWVEQSNSIIDAINLCINSKEIYNRIHQTILANGKTQGKGMFSFFGGYLQATINEEWSNFTKKMKKKTTLDITEEDLSNWLYSDVLPKAIKRMFDAQPEDGVDQELQSAYQDLAKLVGTFDQAGSFAQQIADIYELDVVAAEIKKKISTRKTKKKPGGINSLTSNAKVNYIRGGYTLEALVDLMVANVLPDDGKSGHSNMGSFGAKVDNLWTIDIDFSEVQEILEEQEMGSRELNIRAFNELGEKLNKLNSGFLVYTSDKNYTLNDGFRQRGGFSSGTSLSLRQYEQLMLMANKNARQFIGAIEQLASGAVGQADDKTDYADIISKNIAYLLFDDYNTIGVGLENGPNAIHIMNLNGLFVPISSILYALGDAISNEENIKGIVKTNIILPAIKFPSAESQRSYEKSTGSSAWWAQKEEMLDKGKIQTHFLGNLKKLLQSQTLR